ncbi:hypothetical protein GCM10011614_00170 [Novosphingobium colocasiae]|uniref:Uncharacterized protein n=1 Tax=Novosphingobium colocasiae TaxID=1256513 RepID=A0A918P848_9SPHN|nr:hypothetical protein GCM10011614_00170 [Novosphingobium colocasiae]
MRLNQRFRHAGAAEFEIAGQPEGAEDGDDIAHKYRQVALQTPSFERGRDEQVIDMTPLSHNGAHTDRCVHEISTPHIAACRR